MQYIAISVVPVFRIYEYAILYTIICIIECEYYIYMCLLQSKTHDPLITIQSDLHTLAKKSVLQIT